MRFKEILREPMGCFGYCAEKGKEPDKHWYNTVKEWNKKQKTSHFWITKNEVRSYNRHYLFNLIFNNNSTYNTNCYGFSFYAFPYWKNKHVSYKVWINFYPFKKL